MEMASSSLSSSSSLLSSSASSASPSSDDTNALLFSVIDNSRIHVTDLASYKLYAAAKGVVEYNSVCHQPELWVRRRHCDWPAIFRDTVSNPSWVWSTQQLDALRSFFSDWRIN